MLRLETLGGLALRNEAGREVATQRRRLGFLALLAGAADRGLARDKLLAYLWPESEAGSSRHALEQLLYELRRQFGDTLFLGTDPLRLNPELIASDLATFEAALARGAHAEAVAAYRGPFLDGFYLSDAGEFEQWVEAERARVAGQYVTALERVAQAATEQGDAAGAVKTWRKLVALDRVSSRSALGLLRALAAAGERPEALRFARTYETLVRQELETSPDPAFEAFVRQLRASPGAEVPEAAALLPQPPTAREASVPSAARPVDSSRIPSLLPRLLVGVAAVAAVVMAGTWVTRRITESSPSTAPDPNRILVVPFRVTSADSSLLILREGIVDLVAARLTGEGGPSAVDPRTALSAWRRLSLAKRGGEVPRDTLLKVARALGAGQVLLGEVVIPRTGQMLLSGRLVSSRDGSAGPRASVTGSTEQRLGLIDQLVSRLLILRAGEDQQRLASLLTTSPQALDAFLQGRAESRLAHDAVARRHFARALDYDSTFALAAVELVLARGWLFRWATMGTDSIVRTRGIQFGGGGGSHTLSEEDQWDRAMELAWRGNAKLNKADRALLLALRGDHYPRPSYAREMLGRWEQAVRAAPDRPEAHYSLGYVLLSQGLVMGLADSRARAAASFRHALELDSAFLSPITGLVEIAALERDTSRLRRLRALYVARDSVGEEADYVRWLTAAVLRDESELRRIRSRFTSLDLGTLSRILSTSQMVGIALDDAERADSAILARANEGQQRFVALHHAVSLALNRGQPDRALGLMVLKREVDPSSQLQQGRALRYALMWDGDSAAGAGGAHAFEASLAQPASRSARAAPERNRRFSVALWRLWYGDTTGAADAIERLRRERVGSQAALLDALLAGIVRRPDAGATLARLDSTALLGCCDLPQFINLVSARLHERTGDLPAALAAVRRGRWLFPPEYLSTYLREEGRLAALTGDTAGAIAAYRHYLALRFDPEPSLRPAADSVRAELARLERGR